MPGVLWFRVPGVCYILYLCLVGDTFKASVLLVTVCSLLNLFLFLYLVMLQPYKWKLFWDVSFTITGHMHHSYLGEFRVSKCAHSMFLVSGRKPELPGENPHRKGENMQTPYRVTQSWTQNLPAVLPLPSFTEISNGNNSTSELFMCIHAHDLKWLFFKRITIWLFFMFVVNSSHVIQVSFVICSWHKCDEIKVQSVKNLTHCKDCTWMIFQSCVLMDPDWYLACLLPVCQHQIPWARACALADRFTLDLQQWPCVLAAAQKA